MYPATMGRGRSFEVGGYEWWSGGRAPSGVQGKSPGWESQVKAGTKSGRAIGVAARPAQYIGSAANTGQQSGR